MLFSVRKAWKPLPFSATFRFVSELQSQSLEIDVVFSTRSMETSWIESEPAKEMGRIDVFVRPAEFYRYP